MKLLEAIEHYLPEAAVYLDQSDVLDDVDLRESISIYVNSDKTAIELICSSFKYPSKEYTLIYTRGKWHKFNGITIGECREHELSVGVDPDSVRNLTEWIQAVK